MTFRAGAAENNGSGKVSRLVELCLCACIHLHVSKDHVGEAVLISIGEPKNVFELQDLLSSQLFK